MRVLIADKLLPSVAERLSDSGCEVSVDPSLSGDALADAVGRTDAQVLVVRSTKVPADVLAGSSLGLVVRAGAGVNTIDMSTASARGVYVANCPGRNSLAVAELTIGLLVALDRRIPDAVAELRAGRWNKAEYGEARGLAGRRLGVVGAGQIGMAVAHQARGLGMHVTVWNRGTHRREAVERAGFAFNPDLIDLAANCEAVSVHLAATPETEGLAGADFFAALPDNAFFINTSRCEVVDEAALLDAVRTRGVRAALDVFSGEGAGGTDSIDVPLLREPGVIATPHIGASTMQAQEAVADEVVRIVQGFVATGRVANVVNVTAQSPASHMLVVRHLNRVGVLAHVFLALKNAQINVQETENIIFDGGKACIARIAIDSAPSEQVLTALHQGSVDLLDLQLVTRRL